MPIYAIEDLHPVVDPTAFIHPTATLIGDVIIGANCYVGPGASLRGDFGRIIMKKGSNIQDNCVAHSFPNQDCIVEEDGHIGHGAVLHGCTIGRNTLVGMNSVVMDKAVIEADCLVAACSFVKGGFNCPPKSLVAGIPANILRTLSDKEIAWKSKGTAEYQLLATRCHASLREVKALQREQDQRPRFDQSTHQPKSQD